MKAFSKVIIGFSFITLAFATMAGHHGDGHQMKSSNTIVDVAKGAGSFSTLLAALDATKLDKVLKGDGPFTVFAPTDEAFEALPAGTLENLLANPDKLAAILKYHVVAGKATASDVVNLTSVDTVQGDSLAIDTRDGVKVGSANVVTTDVMADNGVIHVIDAVLIP